MTMSLRHRFFLATLAGSALAGALFVVSVTLLLTPRVARRLVEQDARVNLMALTSTMPRGDGPAKDDYLRRSMTPAWKGVELLPRAELEKPDESVLVVTVPVPETTLALSIRPTVSLKAALAVANPSPWRLAGSVTAFLLFLYLLTWALSRFVTRPLLELEAAVTALSEGERDVSVVLPREQELARLAGSFNAMAVKLRQREQELAKANQQLEAALQAKERIFANTSHELRTPLTVILGYAQMLQDGLKGPLSDEQRAGVEVIERNARQLLSQVEDLLTLSRLKAGQLPVNEESVDLKDLVDEVLANFKPVYGDQPLDVTWSREGPFPARLDYRRGCQILSNLLDNARKYAGSGPVRVHLRESQGCTEIEVKDSGPGVTPELGDNLFVEFERGREGAEGAGLGLALARGLARQLGGDLDLAATSAEGSTFVWKILGSPETT